MRTQFTFYKSFFDNLMVISDDNEILVDVLIAMQTFCIYGQEPEFKSNKARFSFNSMRPQLEYGNEKSEIAKTNNFKLKESLLFEKLPLSYKKSLKNEINSKGGKYDVFEKYCIEAKITSKNFMTTYSVLKAKNNKANTNHSQQSENALEVPQNDFKHLFDMETIENFPPIETDYGTVEEFEDFKELLENVESNVYIRSGDYLYTYDFETKEIITNHPDYKDDYYDDALVCFYIGWKEKGFQYNLSNI